MRNKTTSHSADRPQNTLPPGVQRIDDVLDDLLAQFSARFPEFKLLVLRPIEGLGPNGLELATAPIPV